MKCLIGIAILASILTITTFIAKILARMQQQREPLQTQPQQMRQQTKRHQSSYRIDVADTSSGISEDGLLKAIRDENWDHARELAQYPITVMPGEAAVPIENGTLRLRLYGNRHVNVMLYGARGSIKLAIDLPIDVMQEMIQILQEQERF